MSNETMSLTVTDAQQVALNALLTNSHSENASDLAASLFNGALRGRAQAAKKSAKEVAGKNYDLMVAHLTPMGVTMPQTRGEFINAQVVKWDEIVRGLDAENTEADSPTE